MRLKLLIPSLLFCSALFAQDWPNTLLWKISGNGLKKDSYLYGTMHVQDKRLFRFPDSLYHFLEKADGYAMEVDFAEIMDSIMIKAINLGAEKRKQKNKAVKIDAQIVDTAIVIIDEEVQEPPPPPPPSIEMVEADIADLNKPATKRRIGWKATNTKEEMPTIMDAWFFGLAKRQGKWIGGVEDVSDQLSILDEFGANITLDGIKEGESKRLSDVLEDMIRIYLDRDLNKIEDYVIHRETDLEESWKMKQRNRKMAMRMDSLAQVRSMLFAVGAAHLPGDTGVIKLLRQAGYLVQPVFSSFTTDVDSYLKKMKPAVWEQVKDANGFYTLEMPGQPTRLNLEIGMEGDFYIDAASFNFYMVSAIPSFRKLPSDSLMQLFAQGSGSKVSNMRVMKIDSLDVAEGLIDSDGTNMILRLVNQEGMIFMLLAGNLGDNPNSDPDLQRFLRSFKSLYKPGRQKSGWTVFEPAGKGVRLQLPGKPKANPSVSKTAEGTNWIFNGYDYFDLKNQGYYMINIRELRPGFHLGGDSLFFQEISSGFNELFTSVDIKKFETYQGYPAYYVLAQNDEQSVTYGSRVVNRGNRVYHLVAAVEKSADAQSKIDTYLNSLELLDYPSPAYTLRGQDGFRFKTMAPAAFQPAFVYSTDLANKPEKGEPVNHFISFDSSRVISYEVMTSPISPYARAKSDTAFLNLHAKDYVGYADSVLQFRQIKDAAVPSLEWLVQMPDNNIQKRFRMLLGEDSIYTLICFAQQQELASTNIVFNNFSLPGQKPFPLEKSKTKELLQALQSTDSATFELAKEAIVKDNFTESDLPALHKALLADYADDSSGYYWGARGQLRRVVAEMADQRSLDFVRKNYPKQVNSAKLIQYELLHLLSSIPSKESYQLLGRLLKENPPARLKDFSLYPDWYDSLELARILYPGLLDELQNPVLSNSIMRLTSQLLDEEYIVPADISMYSPQFLELSRQMAKEAKSDVEDAPGIYEIRPLLDIIQVMGNSELNEQLKEFIWAKHPSVKMIAALRMLDLKWQVPPVIWDSLAADIYYRRDIWDSLDTRKQLHLFPKAHQTQILMADSDIYNYVYDDYKPASIKMVEERIVEINAVKKKVYVYEIRFDYEDYPSETYAAICGAFDLDPASMANDRLYMASRYVETGEKEEFNELVEEMMQTALEEMNKEE